MKNKSSFKKGHSPWNKGLKGLPSTSPDTKFKKGHLNLATFKPIDSERMDKDGAIEIKVENRQKNGKFWKRKHIVIWEDHHKRSVPENHIVRFLDGNKYNFAIDNLILVSRAENLMLNHLKVNEMPVEVRLSFYLMIKIQAKVKHDRND